MPHINGPQDGPVAVTGASGYIGSHVVRCLVRDGYTVHACVRDASRKDKTAHLLAMGEQGPGTVRIFSADLLKAQQGAYDEAFQNCVAVFHVAADLGSDPNYGRPTPQRTFDSCMTATQGVLESARQARTVRRVVYTSSTSAVMGLRPGGKTAEGYEYKDDDWAGEGPYETIEERWTVVSPRSGKVHKLWTLERQAYAMGKVEAEQYAYRWGAEHGIDVVSCCPCHVLGPLLIKAHDATWQHRIGLMLQGRSGHRGRPNMLWNIVDVRDVAKAQVLMATSDVAKNGSRYMLAAPDSHGELTVQELLDTLAEIYPNVDIAGDYAPPPTEDQPHGKSAKAIRELGLRPHTTRQTLRDTCESLFAVASVKPALKRAQSPQTEAAKD
ncbi:MAG: NAD-dependent epimerase/dehydratase family protein [Myxococcales bacterium]|nr:NAD-dependent epimerase/dehydratase family protein [Myxococcales bacterium]MDD9968138.1 NAD-dependent epimerase/dehydratase family protein [Myxococcales bacterium]